MLCCCCFSLSSHNMMYHCLHGTSPVPRLPAPSFLPQTVHADTELCQEWSDLLKSMKSQWCWHEQCRVWTKACWSHWHETLAAWQRGQRGATGRAIKSQVCLRCLCVCFGVSLILFFFCSPPLSAQHSLGDEERETERDKDIATGVAGDIAASSPYTKAKGERRQN